MKTRLFIAVTLSAALRDQLAVVRKIYTAADARWVPADKLHLTVYFCGDVATADIPAMEEALKHVAAQQRPHLLVFSGIRFAPHACESRMIWATFHASEQFQLLAAAIARAAQPYSAHRTEERAVSPHVTLARFEHVKPRYDATLEAVHASDLPVTSVVLVASENMPSGSVYTTLATIPLGGLS